MNFDDSLLTAYLDGELSPDRRLIVESALLNSPRLSARLGDLRRLRDVLDGLPRPEAPIDFAPLVLDRIRRAEADRRRRRARFRRALVLGPVTAAATVLLLTFLQGGWHQEEPIPVPRPVAPGGTPTSPAPAVALDERPPSPSPEFIGPPAPERLALAAETPTRPEPRGPLRELLGRPDVRRILVRVEDLDEATLGRVNEAIVATHRSDPRRARLRVPAEPVVEPERPGEAAVFVVVMDDAELGRFRDRLADRFPAAGRCESDASPELLAALDAAPGLEVLREHDRPAGTLLASGSEFGDVNARRVAEPDLAAAGDVAPLPVGVPAPEASAAPDPVLPPEAGESRIYLIWVLRKG